MFYIYVWAAFWKRSKAGEILMRPRTHVLYMYICREFGLLVEGWTLIKAQTNLKWLYTHFKPQNKM